MRGIAVSFALLLVTTISPRAIGEQVRPVSTCFEELVAPLRLSQLEQLIAQCDKVIEGKGTAVEQRADALGQRGLAYARRYSILMTHEFAIQGIADITEALRLNTPQMARKHLLLVIRAQLYAATGQVKQAFGDYAGILHEDPKNVTARDGLKRMKSMHGF